MLNVTGHLNLNKAETEFMRIFPDLIVGLVLAFTEEHLEDEGDESKLSAAVVAMSMYSVLIQTLVATGLEPTKAKSVADDMLKSISESTVLKGPEDVSDIAEFTKH